MDVVSVEFFINVWVLLYSRLRTHTVRAVPGLFFRGIAEDVAIFYFLGIDYTVEGLSS
jgi:hypothetical protein